MRRGIAYVLLVTMLVLQLQMPVFAARIKTAEKAQLEVSLNLDYPILDAKREQVKLSLLQEGTIIKTQVFSPSNSTAKYEGIFEGLPLGTYQVRLEAPGYKTYESGMIELRTHEKHIVLGTANGTFTSGDINQDGVVDALDITYVEERLTAPTRMVEADLNGDGKVDIEDLSQIYWNQDATGDAAIYNTRIIMTQMADQSAMINDLIADNEGNVEISQGSIENLFDNSENTELVLENKSGEITPDNPVKLPIAFVEPVKVSEVRLTGTPTQGKLVWINEEGQKDEIEFGQETEPQRRSLWGRAKANTITINLGKQVPIQKITVEVTGTEGGNHLASISKIEFLEDVVGDAVNQEQGIIKGFKGEPKDEAVALSWNRVPNITGYRVQYGKASGQYEETMYVSENKALVEGLENFKPYYLVVQATNGDWEGPLSDEVVVTPKPQQKPKAPQNLLVEPEDSALTLTWVNGDEAEGSNLYYKKKDELAYQKVGEIKGERATIYGLENGQTYSVYATAYNSVGESAPSQVVEGVPVRSEIIIPKVPTHKQLSRDNVSEIVLRDARNVDMKFYPDGFTTENMIDKDYNTHWTARTYQQARGFVATFDKPYEMDYVAFVSRLDKDLNSNRWYKGYPDSYGIRIWESETAEPQTIVNTNKGATLIPGSGEEGLFILPFPKSTVYKIEVVLYEWDGAGNISISEAMFYEYYDLVERINQLFEDGTYTTLRSGVTLEQITALETELRSLEGARLQVAEEVLLEELQIARDITQTGTSPRLEEVIVVNQDRNPAQDADRQFAMTLSGLQPTGMMANAGERVLVYVDAPDGGDLPELVFTQYFGKDAWRKTVGLQQGRNVIEVPKVVNYNGLKGGAVYLEYNGQKQEQTRIHMRRATAIPTLEIFDLSNTSEQDKHKAQVEEYITHLTEYVGAISPNGRDRNPANSTEIGTNMILLSVPASGILESIQQGIEGDLSAQVERLYEALMTWEANMDLQYGLLGLSKNAPQTKHQYPNARVNVRYMPMTQSAFMYATNGHIGIQYGSEKGLVNGSRDASGGYFGWGINHEIGHAINTNEYVYGEITNNIFAIAAQTINGGPSRLETSNKYEKIYDKVVKEDTGLSSDVFVTLGMFWQLYLEYEDFYPRLNQLVREDATTGLDKHNTLARFASDVVGKDLSGFFDKWDLPLTAETRAYTAKYPAETRAIYYLNDDAKRYQNNKGGAVDFESLNLGVTATVVDSEVTEDGQKPDDKDVMITINHDEATVDSAGISGVLGYEIYRNDELIAFTTEREYRDQLPEGNNVSYTYEVVAYDKLLNKSEVVVAESVHVATEGIISRNEYTILQTTPGMITIDMNKVQEVVGIKVSDAMTQGTTTTGAFTVEVSEDGVNWQTAKRTQLANGENLLYFNKPDTTDEDQRIWTYDVKYMRVVGEDVEGLMTSQIDLIAYPGDAVYFTEGAIGRLGHDYVYNGGVIEEGSLVVLGTYRGHPVYSKIVLSAKYVADKDYDTSEKPDHVGEVTEAAINGEVFLFAELPEDNQISKINNGIWLFAPTNDQLPAQIKANMYRTDAAESVEGGRLVSDTLWMNVPDLESLPTINLQ
ncbi:MAG: M60 family metallopeptidase [Cellulosilyticaceae bacterium]